MKQDYFSYRKKAIAWINSKKQSFNEGLAILMESGYKPIATANVAKLGENNDFARAKLKALMYEFIRLWSKKGTEVKDEQPEQVIVPDKEPLSKNQVAELCNKENYPPVIRKVIHEFYRLLEERRKLHSQAAAITGNEPKQVYERNELFERIEAMSERMDVLWAMKTKFEQDGTVPTEDIKQPTKKKEVIKEKHIVPQDASVTQLKKLKKNTNTKLIRARNMLEYGKVTKATVPEPLPAGPKRAKYEKLVEELSDFIKRIDYRIVELS